MYAIEMETQHKDKPRLPIKSVITWIIVGYLAGVVITILWHIYIADYDRSINITRWIVLVLLVLFIFILCYSRGVRCTLTLAIPILFTSKGRSLMMAFAFVLAATGPTMNIFDNVEVMTTSLSCGQTQLKVALGEMLDTMKKPLVAIKEAIGVAMNEVRHVMERVQVVLYRIQELVMIILASIKNAFAWLDKIVSVCNREFGTPFDRCMKIANDAMQDCRDKLGPIKGICRVTHLFSALCYSVKFIDVICVLIVYFDETIFVTVLERLKRFTADIKNIFDVSITFDHDFYFKTVASKDLQEVGADIMADIRARMGTFFLIFGWLNIIGSFLCCTIILKALYFKMKYIRNTNYNNKYITKDFYAIDEQRQRNQQEVALPLTSSERKKYVKITGCRLTRAELLKIARSMIFLVISSAQLFCICFTDYSFYWLLSMISYYGHQEAGLEVPPFITVDVEGGGFVGDIFKGIVHAFEPLSQNYTVDFATCLPNPKKPNYIRYWQIAFLCIMSWALLFCQPYGLRLRHIVMRFYYPEVARERALWLYNEILMKRMTFFKFARRKARVKFLNGQAAGIDDFTFLDWLRAKTDRFWIFRFILGKRKGDHCIICSTPVKDDKVLCNTLGCKGIYCPKCYKEANNICCLCSNPIEYGDLSDISEVRDSSDEMASDEVHVYESDKYCSSRMSKRYSNN